MPPNTKKLSRTALLIEDASIIKTEPETTSLGKAIYRLVLGGSLPFQNEMYCYIFNPKSFPDIDVVTGANIIIIRYDKQTRAVSSSDISFALLTQLFTEINKLRGHSRFGPIKRTLFWLLNSPVPRSLRDLKQSNEFTIGEKLRLSVKLICLQALQSSASSPGRLIHNDLMLHNILFFGEHARPIDFEDSLVERKWIFTDILDLMFQAQTWSRKEILDTLRRLAKDHSVRLSEEDLQKHFTMGFLRYFIRSTRMARRSAAEQAEAATQIRGWLDDKF